MQVAIVADRLVKMNNPTRHSTRSNGLPKKSSAKSHAKPPAKKKTASPRIRKLKISRSICLALIKYHSEDSSALFKHKIERCRHEKNGEKYIKKHKPSL